MQKNKIDKIFQCNSQHYSENHILFLNFSLVFVNICTRTSQKYKYMRNFRCVHSQTYEQISLSVYMYIVFIALVYMHVIHYMVYVYKHISICMYMCIRITIMNLMQPNNKLYTPSSYERGAFTYCLLLSKVHFILKKKKYLNNWYCYKHFFLPLYVCTTSICTIFYFMIQLVYRMFENVLYLYMSRCM